MGRGPSWTYDEMEIAKKMARTGATNIQIAQATGKPLDSVKLKVCRHHWRKEGWKDKWANWFLLWNDGLSYAQVARSCSTHPRVAREGIHRHMDQHPEVELSHGRKMDLGLIPRPACPPGPPKKAYRLWTTGELRTLQTMVARRIRYQDIAKTLDRTEVSVRAKALTALPAHQRHGTTDKVSIDEARAWLRAFHGGESVRSIAERTKRRPETVGRHIRVLMYKSKPRRPL